MRCVVKNKENGCFLRSSGEWTKFLSEAQQFPNGLSVALHLEGAGKATRSEEIEVIRLPLG